MLPSQQAWLFIPIPNSHRPDYRAALRQAEGTLVVLFGNASRIVADDDAPSLGRIHLDVD